MHSPDVQPAGAEPKPGTSVGAIHGRFQPFHLGHLAYAKAAKEQCDFLYIGITNPDPRDRLFQSSDPNRSRDISNPFTFWERSRIIRSSMIGTEVPLDKIEVVPFPINTPELLQQYVPEDATYYMTIYDEWGRHKRDVLSELGLKVEVLWERDASLKEATGTEVRRRMADGSNWRELVSEHAAKTIVDLSLDKRVKKLHDEQAQ